MRLRDPDLLAGALMSVLVVSLAVPVLLIGGDVLEIALPAWLALFVAMCATMFTSMWLGETLPRRRLFPVLAAMLLCTWAVVATGPRLGFLSIVAVVAVAVCAYHLPRPVVRVVAVLNTVAVAASLLSVDAPWSSVLFSAVVYLVLQLVTVMSIEAQLSEARTRAELQATNADLRATRALLQESSRSQERLRIARDLHDVAGHQLTALILELEIASHRTEGTAREHVVKARTVARELMDDVRAAVGTERALAPDLAGSLHQVTADLPGLRVHLDVDNAVRADADTVTALVRATQEVVTNTLRHAHATTLWVEVGPREGGIGLVAHDDGVGAPDFARGNGLQGMEERVQALGGTLAVEPGPGFRVRIALPARVDA